jgi:hypothetical protein
MRWIPWLTSVSLLLGTACSKRDAEGSCPPGSLRIGGECVRLCANDLECEAGRICADGTCVPGDRPAPRITALDGDGADLCPDAPSTHCVATGLWVSGENLEGGAFALTTSPGGTRTPLTVLAVEAGRVHVGTIDPTTFPAGGYVLSAANAAGSADQGLTFLQGPPGPAMTPNDMIAHINTGSTTLNFARLAGVAPLSHTHGAADLTALPSHSHGVADLDVPGICAATCTGACQSCSGAGVCQPLDDRAQHGCTSGFVCVRGECEQQIVILVNELAGTCDSLCSSHAGGRPCVDVGIDEAGTDDRSMAAGPASCQTYAAACATAMTWDGLAGPTCSHHRYGLWTNCRCSF